MTPHLFVITGPPGSGKTPIIRELASMGFSGVAEPAREVIAEQRASGGSGLWERDRALFCRLMLSRALDDFERHRTSGRPVFFDRALPDLVAYAEGSASIIAEVRAAMDGRRYNDIVFFAPSWPEIYTTDEDRTATFEMAHEFGETIRGVYLDLGYTILEVPKATPAKRAAFVLDSAGVDTGK